MSANGINQVRLDQTCRQLSSLRDDISQWLKRRRCRDKLSQHETQLKTLEIVLSAALSRLQTALNSVSLEVAPAKLYSTCRLFEQRIVWVRRVWDYFREKFDQRDDERLGALLAAADEVVWSCYAGVFRRASDLDPRISQGPAPLPFVDLRYSPHSIPRAEPPSDLKFDIDAPFVREFLQQLPIPLVALPNSCVNDPWWLVSLGHEVGHHVQYDLLPDWELVGSFGETIGRAVTSAQTNSNDSQIHERWKAWGREIFADLFSIFCMGPWALWMVNEVELADDQAMTRNKTLYPAPVTRLALMRHILKSLDLADDTIERAVKGLLDRNGTPLSSLNFLSLETGGAAENGPAATIKMDLKVAPFVAAALVEVSVGPAGGLKELCSWDKSEFEPYETVFTLAADLLKSGNPRPVRSLKGARLFASAAIAAWVAISAMPSADQRAEGRAKLTEKVLPTIRESRQEGTRAATKETSKSEFEALGAKLGDQLLNMEANDLQSAD
jgi:hypothetical protein